MTQEDSKRLRKRRVKQVVAACLATSALTAPLGWLLVGNETRPDESPSTIAVAPTGQGNEPSARSVTAPAPPRVQLSQKQSWVRELASGETSDLERLAREGSAPSDRLAAVSLLWERGEVERVRELAQGDRLLSAKLKALESSRPAAAQAWRK